MKHRISIVQTLCRLQSIALVAVAMFIPFATSATTVKALSFAIYESNGSGDKTPIRNYMVENGIDFGAFDFAKSSGYFINSDFPAGVENFKAVWYSQATSNSKCFIYDSNKYELVDDPATNKPSGTTAQHMAAAFRDEYGDTNVLVSLRGSYSVSNVKNYLDGIASRYPGGRIIVTYNERVGTSNSETLNASLTDSSSGPGMICLGSTSVDDTSVGGVYMYPADAPAYYSVDLVPKSIGTVYNGTLATLEFPTKYKVIFNDWNGTALQTNVVISGGVVTPPIPVREGYTFLGWDHPDSDFGCVLGSFTATALYDTPTLIVSGDPENLGTADPAYGITTTVAADDSFTASVTLPAVEPDATERLICSGYTHYQITDVPTGAKTVVEEGSASSFQYTHRWLDEIVWHFAPAWLITFSSTEGGSVSVGGESVENAWVRDATTISITATPESGYAFLGWEGDTDGIEDITATNIDLVVTAARSLRATFILSGVADPSVQYVATDGDDEKDGYSTETAKLTIQAAVDTLASSLGYGTVHVAAGTYQITSGIVITNAINVLGETGDPADVIVRNTKMGNQDQVIVFSLNHPDAFVANLTAADSHRYAPTSPYGGNVSIQEAGGTVSNCILRGAVSGGNYTRGAGAWLNSDNALLTHCIITNNSASGSGYQLTAPGGVPIYGGIFVHVERGTVANCLIANNHDSGGTGAASQEKQAWSCGVTLRTSGRLVNCTVVTNEARYTAGVYLYPTSYATNVVVAGCVNRCTWYNGGETPIFTEIGFKGTLANASHCASDGGEALTDNCIAGTAAEFFRSVETRDYRPALASPLVNNGVTYEGIASFDLLGKKRVQGRAPDIGAYESTPRRLTIHIR